MGKAITFYCENSFDLRDLLKGPFGDRGPHCESWGPDRAFLPQALEESVILPVEDSSLNFFSLLPRLPGSPGPGAWHAGTQRGPMLTLGACSLLKGKRAVITAGLPGETRPTEFPNPRGRSN